ncbi:hypothetical protein [Domibacillus mangrovi]|uniref:Uncharacterized protein n=1 Tax=Domibacillus mangrovi TaxID=1714354 RepID=A0A1Q5P6B1_9BACI|nr:hypothetical protein [Domibacillus mangrovi]OKL37809.1 hypothetical protein BLL40_03005 [Domibacillus mangrovi]
MAITYPHIEESDLTHYISPKGEYQLFQDEDHYAEKVREWGLSSTKEVKKEFWYKDKTYQRLVTIKGYEEFGVSKTFNTLVIEFQDGHLSCILPDYLKDMQSSNFGKEDKVNKADAEERSLSSTRPAEKPKAENIKKAERPKLELPVEKVHFTGIVKQFALSWNHFNEENDEVVVLDQVQIDQENPIDVGIAWCSHSKTLKKVELQLGERIEFDGKIVKKKLPKGKEVEEAFILDEPASFKINNPSKIVRK